MFPFQTALGVAAQLFQAYTRTPAKQVTPTSKLVHWNQNFAFDKCMGKQPTKNCISLFIGT